MKDRIAALLQHKGLTNLSFATIMKVHPSSISHILSGRNLPSCDFLIKLLQVFPDVNPDWMLLGLESMYRADDLEPDELSFTDNYDDNSQDILINDTEEVKIDDIEIKTPVPEPKIEQIPNDIIGLFDKKQSKIAKIVIFYKDGTFDDFSSR